MYAHAMQRETDQIGQYGWTGPSLKVFSSATAHPNVYVQLQ